MSRLFYAVLPVVIVAALVAISCQVDVNNNDAPTTIILTSPSFPTAATPAGTPAPGGPCIASSVRIGPFGFDCVDGVPVPSNTSGRLPLGCVAVITATPKYPDGSDIPAAVHGPNISWSLIAGQNVVSVLDFPGEPFNKLVRPLSDTTADTSDRSSGPFTLTATVCGVTGSYTAQVF